MSSKIDGVPREWLENYAGLLTEHFALAQAREVRELLAAPAVERQVPNGAIENGRAFMERVEQLYDFTDEHGHQLANCSDWQEFVKCFEYLAEFASPPAPVAVDDRAEFENYYRDRIMGNRTGVRFLRSDSGSYLDREVREMWSGWQARACLDKVKEMNA